MTFTLTEAGLQCLVQDLGRPGLASMGVSRSGAFDRRALVQGNTLLGNRPGNPGLEVLGGGIALLAADNHLVALTGAPAAARIDGDPVAHGRVLSIHRGQVLRLGAPMTGLRTYVTVAGGLEVDAVLGSASTDTLSGLGPAALRNGDRLGVGPDRGHAGDIDIPALLAAGDITVRVTLGPRDDWFEGTGALLTTGWTVNPSSDRVGIRLDGAVIARSRGDELPSEPCVRGSIQVTSDGRPIVFGPDHPVTGGYPVIAVVHDADTDHLAQARPGQKIRFVRP